MTKVEERIKETSDRGRQVRQKDSPLQNEKAVTGQALARQEKKVDLLGFSYKGGCWLKDKSCDCRHLPLHVVHKRTMLVGTVLSFRPFRQR